MKIILLTTDFYPNIGGIAAHVAGLAGGLSRLGHEVAVFVAQADRKAWLPRSSRERLNGFDVLRLAAHPRLYARVVARRLQAMIGAGFRVAHWHTFDQEVMSRLRGAAKVFTNHTSYFLEYIEQAETMPKAQAIVAPADFVIGPSTELVEATCKAGYPAGKTRFICNGVDTERFSPAADGRELRQRLGIADEEVVFLCPRRLEKKTGVIYWIEAIPPLLARCARPMRFLIVGDYLLDNAFSARQEVLHGIEKLKLGERVIFTGAIPHTEMQRYFAASDVVVLPSLIEATSIAGLEAMAAGKPVLGTTVGGIPQIVADDATGLLVPPGDSHALSEAAARLAADDALRARLGAAARARCVAEFDWHVIASRTVEVYEQVLRSPTLHSGE